MAQKGERIGIENAIRKVSALVVRGKAASENKAVRLARVQKVVGVVATALTSFGLASPVLNAIQGKDVNLEQTRQSFAGLPFFVLLLGGLLIIAILIANQLMKEGNIATTAVLSQALSDSFGKLADQVRGVLPYEDPEQDLERLYEDALVLQRYSERLMADSVKCRDRINVEVDELITEYCIHWAAPTKQAREVERR